MQITEIYKSLQGESTHAGLPCVFVRLTGCNLRCSWCDSEYTFQGGHKMTSEEVWNEVRRLSPNGGLVEITGGEISSAARDQRRAATGARARGSHQDRGREVS